MIYVFSYRHGEIEAEVEAKTEEEADERLKAGDAVMFINRELLNPTMWDLADVLEEGDEN